MMKRFFYAIPLTILLVSVVGCLLSSLDVGKNQEAEDRYIGKVENATGTITRRGPEIFVIEDHKEPVYYQPTNLPKEFQQDSLRVIFSDWLLEIDPNIRYFGSPIKLESIRRLDQR